MTVKDLLKTSINVFGCKTGCSVRDKNDKLLGYMRADCLMESPYSNRNVNYWFIKSFNKNINIINEIEIEVADV